MLLNHTLWYFSGPEYIYNSELKIKLCKTNLHRVTFTQFLAVIIEKKLIVFSTYLISKQLSKDDGIIIKVKKALFKTHHD